MLAAALAYRLAMARDWFRIGAWDYRTLLEMLALRWGTTRDRHAIEGALRRFLAREERLVVLDNHEDDAATARLLDALAGTKATFLVTARRCLLAGVLVFPVTAPLVTSGKSAFPRVAALTRALRWNPLALDIADAMVGAGDVSVAALARHLEARGLGRVRVIDHEDDLPEVALLVDWAWERLPPASRRVLAVLAHAFGDHVDAASLAALARCDEDAIAPLERWHLVQESMPRRFALHAVVRYALQKRTTADPARTFAFYIDLLERAPERLDAEQTHLFAAMDHAHRTSDMAGMLRVQRLMARLEARSPSRPQRSRARLGR